MIWKIPTHHSFLKTRKIWKWTCHFMFLFDKLCKENEWTLIQNLAQKKKRQTIPRNICSAPRKLTHLRQRCARKNRPRQVVNEFGLIGCENHTVRIHSLISVLMENYLSMICIISLDKKSYKFHSNAIYKPSNLKYVYTA